MQELLADPTRLLEAREYLGFSVEEIAFVLGIDEDRLHAFEEGGAEPTGAQLERLSKIYLRPVSFLCGEEPPALPPATKEFIDDAMSRGVSIGDAIELEKFGQFLAGRPRP